VQPSPLSRLNGDNSQVYVRKKQDRSTNLDTADDMECRSDKTGSDVILTVQSIDLNDLTQKSLTQEQH